MSNEIKSPISYQIVEQYELNSDQAKKILPPHLLDFIQNNLPKLYPSLFRNPSFPGSNIYQAFIPIDDIKRLAEAQKASRAPPPPSVAAPRETPTPQAPEVPRQAPHTAAAPSSAAATPQANPAAGGPSSSDLDQQMTLLTLNQSATTPQEQRQSLDTPHSSPPSSKSPPLAQSPSSPALTRIPLSNRNDSNNAPESNSNSPVKIDRRAAPLSDELIAFELTIPSSTPLGEEKNMSVSVQFTETGIFLRGDLLEERQATSPSSFKSSQDEKESPSFSLPSHSTAKTENHLSPAFATYTEEEAALLGAVFPEFTPMQEKDEKLDVHQAFIGSPIITSEESSPPPLFFGPAQVAMEEALHLAMPFNPTEEWAHFTSTPISDNKTAPSSPGPFSNSNPTNGKENPPKPLTPPSPSSRLMNASFPEPSFESLSQPTPSATASLQNSQPTSPPLTEAQAKAATATTAPGAVPTPAGTLPQPTSTNPLPEVNPFISVRNEKELKAKGKKKKKEADEKDDEDLDPDDKS